VSPSTAILADDWRALALDPRRPHALSVVDRVD